MKYYCFVIAGALFLGSCASPNYFQVYETKSEDLQREENTLVQENEDVKVKYAFWGSGGRADFTVENKTDKVLYVDLEHSHLIVNGMAKTYFGNRTFVNQSKQSNYYGSSYFNTASKTESINGVHHKEKRYITLPPHSHKVIQGFDLNDSFMDYCELENHPSQRNTHKRKSVAEPEWNNQSKKFQPKDTPLYYTNVLSYSTEAGSPNLRELSADFYVSEISNMNGSAFYEEYYPEKCGKKASFPDNRAVYKSPKRFYVKYKR